MLGGRAGVAAGAGATADETATAGAAGGGGSSRRFLGSVLVCCLTELGSMPHGPTKVACEL